MRQSSLSFRRRKINLRSSLALLFAAFGASLGVAQDIPLGVTYICSGEHIYIENCNIRDLGDNANCRVAHPDKLLPNGMNSYGGNAPAMVTASGTPAAGTANGSGSLSTPAAPLGNATLSIPTTRFCHDHRQSGS